MGYLLLSTGKTTSRCQGTQEHESPVFLQNEKEEVGVQSKDGRRCDSEVRSARLI